MLPHQFHLGRVIGTCMSLFLHVRMSLLMPLRNWCGNTDQSYFFNAVKGTFYLVNYSRARRSRGRGLLFTPIAAAACFGVTQYGLANMTEKGPKLDGKCQKAVKTLHNELWPFKSHFWQHCHISCLEVVLVVLAFFAWPGSSLRPPAAASTKSSPSTLLTTAFFFSSNSTLAYKSVYTPKVVKLLLLGCKYFCSQVYVVVQTSMAFLLHLEGIL